MLNMNIVSMIDFLKLILCVWFYGWIRLILYVELIHWFLSILCDSMILVDSVRFILYG